MPAARGGTQLVAREGRVVGGRGKQTPDSLTYKRLRRGVEGGGAQKTVCDAMGPTSRPSGPQRRLFLFSAPRRSRSLPAVGPIYRSYVPSRCRPITAEVLAAPLLPSATLATHGHVMKVLGYDFITKESVRLLRPKDLVIDDVAVVRKNSSSSLVGKLLAAVRKPEPSPSPLVGAPSPARSTSAAADSRHATDRLKTPATDKEDQRRHSEIPGSGGLIVQRCVVIAKESDGYGLTVTGDHPVFVQTATKRGYLGLRQGSTSSSSSSGYQLQVEQAERRIKNLESQLVDIDSPAVVTPGSGANASLKNEDQVVMRPSSGGATKTVRISAPAGTSSKRHSESAMEDAGMHFVPPQQVDVVPMEEETDDDDAETVVPLDTQGPFSNLIDLKARPAHLAVFINYLLCNASPNNCDVVLHKQCTSALTDSCYPAQTQKAKQQTKTKPRGIHQPMSRDSSGDYSGSPPRVAFNEQTGHDSSEEMDKTTDLRVRTDFHGPPGAPSVSSDSGIGADLSSTGDKPVARSQSMRTREDELRESKRVRPARDDDSSDAAAGLQLQPQRSQKVSPHSVHPPTAGSSGIASSVAQAVACAAAPSRSFSPESSRDRDRSVRSWMDVPMLFVAFASVDRSLTLSRSLYRSPSCLSRNAENLRRLDDLQKRLDTTPFDKESIAIAQDYRYMDLRKFRLVHDGSLTWRFNKGKMVELHVVLLENLLVLLTKSSDGHKLILRCQEPNKDTRWVPVLPLGPLITKEKANDKKSFFIVNNSPYGAQIYEMVAATATERKTWFKVISDQIEIVNRKGGRITHPVDTTL
uniref:PH domain-containing protein n=1 Tax=Plectus sambesii TaxID=2011161 RepID=A0A914VE02_9BILA